MQVNFSYVSDIAGGRQDLLLNLLKAILESLEEYPTKMQAALAAGEFKTLGEVAHKYKSSTNYLGNKEFTHLLDEIEQCRYDANPSTDDLTIKIGLVTGYSSNMKKQIIEKIRSVEVD